SSSHGFRRAFVPLLVTALVALALALAPTASGADLLAGEPVLIGAGHYHGQTEGYFFPGQLPCAGCPTMALSIKQGSNVEFKGLDEEAHQVVSVKKVRRRPLFASSPVKDGASTMMLTERVKPGQYPFFCFFHPEMRGVLEVTP
ncbi:MAG: cupredoxin domain-containing protein, partial [Actinomycetota bacterium]